MEKSTVYGIYLVLACGAMLLFHKSKDEESITKIYHDDKALSNLFKQSSVYRRYKNFLNDSQFIYQKI